MMDVGKRSLANSQTSLQTVAHNIANKSTEGYSRQRVEQVTNEPVGEGNLRIGMGARPGAITRTNNEFLEKQIQKERNNLGYMEGRADTLGRVEEVYNEQVNKGLNQFMAEFFNSFRELSNNPENLAARTMVRESADFLAKDFHRVNNQLTKIQEDSDFRIASRVEEINQITQEISTLNEKIASVELGGAHANDERDRRDLLIKQLGDKVNIKYNENKNGQVTITAGNTALLVSGGSYSQLTTGEEAGKHLQIYFKQHEGSTPVNVTEQITGGEVGGLLSVRDKTVEGLKDNLDQLAYGLATEVNKAHAEGFDRYNKQGNLFFETPAQVKGAAENMNLSESVRTDVGRIAAAGAPGAPGDNRIANILSSLEYKNVFEDGTASFDNFYAGTVGKVGVEAQRAQSALEAQQGVTDQLKNIRESISGVSLDEEATKMIEFQKNFDASARLIRTADEMMDTVLNLKRL
jgi:flagellar hook-associated protein 1 FlgK